MSAVARKENRRVRSVRVGALSLVGAVAVTMFALTAQNGMPDYVPGVSRNTVEVEFALTQQADMAELYPYENNVLRAVRISGRQLREYLEYSTRYFLV